VNIVKCDSDKIEEIQKVLDRWNFTKEYTKEEAFDKIWDIVEND